MAQTSFTIMANDSQRPIIRNPFILQTVRNITNKYGYVTPDNVGDTMEHTVERISLPFDVKNKAGELVMEARNEGIVLQKKIITFKAISSVGHDFHKSKLAEGYQLEKSGDAQAAHWMYQEYLDGARFSANILSSDAAWNLDIQRNDKVKVEVELFEGEGNARILRGTGKTLRIQAAIKAARFNAAATFDAITAIADPEANEADAAADATEAGKADVTAVTAEA